MSGASTQKINELQELKRRLSLGAEKRVVNTASSRILAEDYPCMAIDDERGHFPERQTCLSILPRRENWVEIIMITI